MTRFDSECSLSTLIERNHYLRVRKNGRKSSFFRSCFQQIIVKYHQKKTAMTFETDATEQTEVNLPGKF